MLVMEVRKQLRAHLKHVKSEFHLGRSGCAFSGKRVYTIRNSTPDYNNYDPLIPLNKLGKEFSFIDLTTLGLLKKRQGQLMEEVKSHGDKMLNVFSVESWDLYGDMITLELPIHRSEVCSLDSKAPFYYKLIVAELDPKSKAAKDYTRKVVIDATLSAFNTLKYEGVDKLIF